ncbi:hypothetical protein IT072_02330 [Leifsonia sp. ZF2019]|uniref:hypothetical protein n=1 Tax=Leifsonia sp. ZF2019 TaxID=2781978 RepID=UPI001CBC0B19|nr:hypothetical protein [Leifsonia sp. ZF2019]UAJ78304.1 hypothetical protein IT072_13655 [Leifsonia sp. ZF2019]UAJ79934.1 hypothetical protein IT072_02330 [Leifsonia sp. ZF2019]
MTIRKGLPAKLALTDTNDTRYDFRNLVVCNADGSPRGGVTSPVGANIVAATATMNSAVAAFSAIAVRDNGVVLLANDGPVNVLHAAAPAANSRIDVVYAKQNDSSSTVTTPDANDLPVIAIAQGTAAASPTKPSIPAGAVELATVLIPAGATATNSSGVVVTQTAQFTAAPGGEVPFRSQSDLFAWLNPSTSQLARIIGAESYIAANGWQINHAFAEAAGITPAFTSGVASQAVASVTVSLPTGRFTQPPIPQVTATSGRFTAVVTAVSTTQLTIQVQNNSGAAGIPGIVYWTAKQMTASSAAG